VTPRRPDIILLVTDDQRRGTLDWLPVVNNYIVRHGIRFSRAMVPTSLCCPSRASLLTGEYAHTTKVWSNDAGWRRFVEAGMEAKDGCRVAPSVGVPNGLVGKYLNAYKGTGPPPGWRVWHAFTGSNADYYNYELIRTDGSITRYGTGPGDVLDRRAAPIRPPIRREHSQGEAVLPVSRPYAPHDPSTPAPRHLHLAAPIGSFGPPSFDESDLSDKPPWIRRLPPVSSSFIQDLRVRQYRSMRSVDEAVAAILDAQRARNRLRNTLLIVISDNGLMWGEHRVMGKFVPYSGATRIPLALAWPARLPEGMLDARLALNVDIPVTIAAAAEAAHDGVAGRNLLLRWRRSGSVLEASAAHVPGSNGTNVERPAYCGWRTRRFLFVHYGNGREELYDYANDPWELRDRRGTAPDVQASMRRKAREACRPVPPGFSWG
jgi:N-acetylglucosamine-6-sulfatase